MKILGIWLIGMLIGWQFVHQATKKEREEAIMIIGCKVGCLCSDINKEYCCKECDNVESCGNSCETIQRFFNKEVIIKHCKNSYEIKE